MRLVPGGSCRPGRLFSSINHGKAQSTVGQAGGPRTEKHNIHQTPPENAIKTLNAFVLFSVLSSDRKPLRIPTITASIIISPAEHTVNEIFDIRFRASEVKSS